MKCSILIALVSVLLSAVSLKAQTIESPDSLDALSLEQLMEVKVTIATQSEQTARETPGIITLLTRNDILQMQAIDLVDVLRWVPGLDVAQDVDMALSIGVRGMWGQEGKVLLLIDGHEMQETAYGGYQLAGRYPAHIIERIEIIRGPGSVVYGGNAALSVINITTRKAEQSPTAGINLQGGVNQNGLARLRLNTELAYVHRDFTLKAFLSAAGNRYGTGQVALAGDNGSDSLVMDLAKSAGTRDYTAGLNLGWKKWSLRWLGNLYQHPSYRTLTYSQNMQSVVLGNQWVINRRLELKTQVSLKVAGPWNVVQDSLLEHFDNVNNIRSGFRSILRYQAPQKLELTAGIEAYHDDQDYRKISPVFPNRALHFSLYNLSAFSQALYKSNWGTLTAGARFDYNSFFGSFFVPRFAFTKIISQWHVKLLYSNAYRTPSLYNLKLAPGARPEFLETIETEVGYVNRNHRISLNVFLNNLFDPVLYAQSNDGEDTYRNGTRTGSKGLEIDYNGKCNQWNWSVNYAYNLPHQNQIEAFSLVGNSTHFIAFAAHRINARLSMPLVNGWNLQFNQQFWSERFSQNPGLAPLKIEAQLISGLMVNKRWEKTNIQLNVGVNDVFNSRLTIVQAFSGFISPYQSLGRELIISITKNFGIR